MASDRAGAGFEAKRRIIANFPDLFPRNTEAATHFVPDNTNDAAQVDVAAAQIVPDNANEVGQQPIPEVDAGENMPGDEEVDEMVEIRSKDLAEDDEVVHDAEERVAESFRKLTPDESDRNGSSIVSNVSTSTGGREGSYLHPNIDSSSCDIENQKDRAEDLDVCEVTSATDDNCEDGYAMKGRRKKRKRDCLTNGTTALGTETIHGAMSGLPAEVQMMSTDTESNFEQVEGEGTLMF